MSKKRDIIKSMIDDETYGTAAGLALTYIDDLSDCLSNRIQEIAQLTQENAHLKYQNALLRGQLSTATGIQDHMDPEESDHE